MFNYGKFISEHAGIMSKICDILTTEDVSSQDGELIFMWLAGVSMGKRQVAMTEGNPALGMLTVGWQMGAGDTEDDLE